MTQAIPSIRPDWSSEDATREVLLGFIRLHILFHAAQGPVYGLWLIEELAEHGYKISAGTLYPILHSLASRGLLHRREKLWKGKIRKYYAITPKGRKALAEMQGKLSELAEEVLPEWVSTNLRRRVLEQYRRSKITLAARRRTARHHLSGDG